ncbi:MAG: type IX secretion system membrane protein PorP/SprF [Bacteroidales bacterium]|nr:type IX secretion system membrane protein PorP/SprF [Bacteroidales bacterium]
MKNTTTIKVSAVVALILIMSSSLKVCAQFDPMFTQYTHNEMFINPAYTGSKEALSITALHRQQWVGVEGRPITTSLSMHTPVWENKMGLGLSLMSDEIGVSSRKLMYISYSYRVQTGTKGFLGFGLMGGMHIQANNLATVPTTELNDPNFSNNVYDKVSPNFGFGINYTTDKFFAGVSIPRLLDDHVSFNTAGKAFTDSKLKPENFHYFMTIGRLFRVNENFLLKPSLMTKAVANAPMEFDLTLNSLIREQLWLGLAYRSSADMSAIIGLQLNPSFLISYAYDYPTSSLNKFTAGSHEIVLSALFGYKGKKIVSNRYF